MILSKHHPIIGAIVIEGHVQGLSNVRSLGEAGIPVYVVDKSLCIAMYSKYCLKFFESPDFIKDDFAEFLIEIAEKENIKDWVLIPSNDHAVYTLAKHRLKLECYYKLVTSELEIIERIYDKLKLLDIAKNIDVPIPVTQSFCYENDPVLPSMRFPVITKGRNGLSFFKAIHKKALLSENEDELRQQLRMIGQKFAIDKTFTQELIPFDGSNKTISFTAFCVAGEIMSHWTGEKLREHPPRFGTATFAQSTYIEDCHIQSISLLKALNYTGVCEVEYLRDPRDNKYKLIEINARTWLWVGLAKACGIDYAKIIYDYANNISYNYLKDYRKKIRWINFITDFPISVKLIFKGQLTLSQYIKSLCGIKVNAIFKITDPLPAFMIIIMGLYLYKKRIF